MLTAEENQNKNPFVEKILLPRCLPVQVPEKTAAVRRKKGVAPLAGATKESCAHHPTMLVCCMATEALREPPLRGATASACSRSEREAALSPLWLSGLKGVSEREKQNLGSNGQTQNPVPAPKGIS